MTYGHQVAANIALTLEAQGSAPEYVAQATGLPRASVTRWCTVDAGKMPVCDLVAIAEALGVTAVDLAATR